MDRFQGLLGVVAIFGVAIAASTDRRAISLRTIGLAFAFQVLPVIVFIGALVGLLYYLRVIQLFVDLVGGAIAPRARDEQSRVGLRLDGHLPRADRGAARVAPYLKRLTPSELFAIMTGGFTSVAGSTLVGCALLGAPLKYLLAASPSRSARSATWRPSGAPRSRASGSGRCWPAAS